MVHLLALAIRGRSALDLVLVTPALMRFDPRVILRELGGEQTLHSVLHAILRIGTDLPGAWVYAPQIHRYVVPADDLAQAPARAHFSVGGQN